MLSSILSLPAIPFLLLIRPQNSISTSLNLLFFQLTWSTLILSHSPLVIEIFGTILVRALFFLLPVLLFVFLEAAFPGVVAEWKGPKARNGRDGSDMKQISRVAAWAAVNVVLATLAQAGIESLFVQALHWKSAIKIAKTLPGPAGAAWDLLRVEAGREILTYMVHRYLLHKRGGVLERAHKSWAHSHPPGGSMRAYYDQPLAYLLGRWMPMYLPSAFLRVHALTFFVHTAFVAFCDAMSYSGYVRAPTGWLPFGFVIGWLVRRTEGHYEGSGKNGFGVWGVMDWMLGTRMEAGAEEFLRGKVERGKEQLVDGWGQGLGGGTAKGNGKADGEGKRRRS
ncbi:hypothetical protein BDZ91DRAFT_552293 [Kalaharituber pfeilii]|nr:hypothetical protein BDZ91DRAFT_552293 [Kalaharituber pfeilii]